MPRTQNTERDYEVWEAVGAGAVWVTLTDDRGRETQRQIGGPGGADRMRIKVEDREAMQYVSPNNPFDSGRLRRVDPGAPTEQAAKTDAQLVATLASPTLEEDLMAASEFEVRRLKDLAEAGDIANAVSVGQLYTIKKVIDRRWPPIAPPQDQLDAANER